MDVGANSFTIDFIVLMQTFPAAKYCIATPNSYIRPLT